MTFTNVNKKTTVLIMIGVMVSILLASLDGTIVTTAMPKIISSLQGFDYYTWPMIAYLLCITISMPLFGKLADMYGFKPVYISGIIIFIADSALCGISQNMMQLIFFRGFQGIGGAVLISNSLAIIGMLIFSVVMLIAFAFIETKAEDPIIPMNLFKNSVFNFSAIEMFLISAVMMRAAIFIPLFVQEVTGSILLLNLKVSTGNLQVIIDMIILGVGGDTIKNAADKLPKEMLPRFMKLMEIPLFSS